MSFDKIFDLTAGAYFYFYNILGNPDDHKKTWCCIITPRECADRNPRHTTFLRRKGQNEKRIGALGVSVRTNREKRLSSSSFFQFFFFCCLVLAYMYPPLVWALEKRTVRLREEQTKMCVNLCIPISSSFSKGIYIYISDKQEFSL